MTKQGKGRRELSLKSALNLEVISPASKPGNVTALGRELGSEVEGLSLRIVCGDKDRGALGELNYEKCKS